MFCRSAYSCIQFIQRMIPPPLSINRKQTKPKWFSLLYKEAGTNVLDSQLSLDCRARRSG